jgi:hypothetical protein
MKSEYRTLCLELRPVDRKFVPPKSRTQVMLEVVVIVKQPAAQPRGKDKLPRVVIAAWPKVEMFADDADVLQGCDDQQREQPSSLT